MLWIDTKVAISNIFFLALFAPTVITAWASDDTNRRDGSLVTYSEERAPCAVQSATRNAYFGDLHIHTGYSYDARPLGTKTTPADAYRFARGGSIAIPPYNQNGVPVGEMQLRRPLDFAAVTDHAEFFGEYALCADVENEAYGAEICAALRGESDKGTFPLVKIIVSPDPQRLPEICGEDGVACINASSSLWQKTKDMADSAYDRSADCSFTSFVGYEHTGTPGSNNTHRNVIFRNHQTPERAISYIEAPTGYQLREQLRRACTDAIPGCDVITIPHNTNLSAGAMFPDYTDSNSEADAQAHAASRNAMEPIMEIFQHKGNSECFNGLPDILGEPDELCDMEQMRVLGDIQDMTGKDYEVKFCEKGEIGFRGFLRVGCIAKNDFFRSVLLTGLQDEAALGINSYRIGAIASTDTHISIAGGTDERSWPGHLVDEATLEGRLTRMASVPRRLDTNPGGLAGVWAVENSRDALFDAMQQREVFGTSGTRIRPRVFAGWDIQSNACELKDMIAHGYARGVPMGGTLKRRESAGAPRFLVSALRDPDGAALQKLQLIKGWIDGGGQSHYRVIDVAGQENSAGTVNLDTGHWSGTGASSLCGVFTDSEYDPSEPAYYYLRAVEVPTLRWSWAQCIALKPNERPEECVNEAPKVIQEMAWTSPVWLSSAPPN